MTGPEIEDLSVFAPIAVLGRADLVAQRLGDAIVLGVLGNGERLPSESALAQQFGVALVTAREALEMLRTRRLITTRRGRGGGSFVSYDGGIAEGIDQTRFAVASRTDLRDMAVHYAAIAGQAAALAAARASDEDVERLHEVVADIPYGDDVGSRRGEGLLRVEVAAVARSPRLLKEEVHLQADYGPILWAGLQSPECRAMVQHSHQELLGAIESVDGPLARHIVEDQIEQMTSFAIRLKSAYERARG